jgi:hypothetical protein
MTRVLLAAFLVLVLPGLARAYAWPVQPFDAQHPIRSGFGDPRTVFKQPAGADGLEGGGDFTFHNGVDISADDGSDVYAVASGVARVRGQTVDVRVPDGRTFRYQHLRPAVADGADVTAQETVLGQIQPRWHHVHFAEFVLGRAVNPLAPGHLAPYVDTTRPEVRSLLVRDPRGAELSPLDVKGVVALVAEAYDYPSLPVTTLGWDGLPVAPALVSWRVTSLAGRVVVPETTAFDVRSTLPPDSAFWEVYARGTYQNMPAIQPRYLWGMPGRYLYRLTAGWDTRKVPSGVYALTVTAADIAGNAGTLSTRLRIANGPLPPAPEPPAAD